MKSFIQIYLINNIRINFSWVNSDYTVITVNFEMGNLNLWCDDDLKSVADYLKIEIWQTLETVAEDDDGEKIEDQILTLRHHLLQLSSTEQRLNCAPTGDQLLPAAMESRPQSVVCPATSNIQNTLEVQ